MTSTTETECDECDNNGCAKCQPGMWFSCAAHPEQRVEGDGWSLCEICNESMHQELDMDRLVGASLVLDRIRLSPTTSEIEKLNIQAVERLINRQVEALGSRHQTPEAPITRTTQDRQVANPRSIDNIEVAIIRGLEQHYGHLRPVKVEIHARWDCGTGYRDSFAASVFHKNGDTISNPIGYVDAEGELHLAYRLTYEKA